MNGDVDKLQKLLKENPAAAKEVADEERLLQPIHFAAYGGTVQVIKVLLASGADINATDSDKDTPLHLAAIQAKQEAIEYLLAAGADIRAQNESGRTPLQELIVGQELTLARLADPLLKAEAKAGVKEKERKQTLDLLDRARESVDEVFQKHPGQEAAVVEGESQVAPAEIMKSIIDRTALEQEQYLDNIKGKYVVWSGTVRDVSAVSRMERMMYHLPEGAAYMVDVAILELGFNTLRARISVSRREAQKLKKGDKVKVSGKIMATEKPPLLAGVWVVVQ